MVVLAHPNRQRRVLALPVGDQLVERDRVDHRARQNVGPHLAALLEDADRDVAPLSGCELLQADCCGEARRAAPDDDHVILHGVAFSHPRLSSPRYPHNSTRPPCQFLDRCVNGAKERDVGGDLDTIGIAEARSALAWWLEAGVDLAVQEEPRDWLTPVRKRPPTEQAPAPV